MSRGRTVQLSVAVADHMAWNETWDKSLGVFYADDVKKQKPLTGTLKADSLEALQQLHSYTHEGLQSQMKALCTLQKVLLSMAMEKFTFDNLEEEWQSLTQKRREEISSEGIWTASHIRSDLECHRQWCPEITVKNLAGPTDNGFLQLIQRLMPPDFEDLSKPITIPNPVVDMLFRSSSELMTPPDCMNGLDLIRSFFITMALWQTLLAFYETDEETFVAKAKAQQRENTAISRQEAREAGKQWWKDFRRMRDEHANDLRNAVIVCAKCRRDASRLDEGQRLRACVKCKGVGRMTRYCSRECQVGDWKEGKPVPHKEICGTILPTLPKPVVDPDKRIPVADPSFKRPPALLRQIAFLKRAPHPDYVIMTPHAHGNIGFSFPTSFEKLMFLVMRRRAIQTGDPEAVYTMFLQLAPYTKKLKVSLTALKKQLHSEYKINVTSIGNDSRPPTEEELGIAATIALAD